MSLLESLLHIGRQRLETSTFASYANIPEATDGDVQLAQWEQRITYREVHGYALTTMMLLCRTRQILLMRYGVTPGRAVDEVMELAAELQAVIINFDLHEQALGNHLHRETIEKIPLQLLPRVLRWVEGCERFDEQIACRERYR